VTLIRCYNLRNSNIFIYRSSEEAEFLEENLRVAEIRRTKMEAEIAAAIAPSDYIVKDELQCKFNTNSYKMMYVVNSENYFYFKGALKRAKDVNHLIFNSIMEILLPS